MRKKELLVALMRVAGTSFVLSAVAVVAGPLSPAELMAAVPSATSAGVRTALIASSEWPRVAQAVTEDQQPTPVEAPAAAPDAVVPPVKREKPETPAPAAPSAPAEAQQPAAPEQAQPAETKAPETPPAPRGMLGRLQDWMARANREFQNVIIKDLSVPPAGKTADDEIAKKLQETKAEEAKKAEEARAASDAQDQAKREEEKRRAAAKDADAQRKKAEDEARKAAELLKKRAAEEAKKAAAAPATPQAPEADAAAKEKARIADELRKTEEAQQAEARKKLEGTTTDADRAEKARAEAERQAEEAQKLEAERRKAEALIAEERKKRERDAAEARRRNEEALRQQAERQQPPPAVQPAPVEQPGPVQQPRAIAQPEPVPQPPAVASRRVIITSEPLGRAQVERRYAPRETVATQRERDGATGGQNENQIENQAAPRERRRHVRLYRVAEARVPYHGLYRGTAVKRFVYRLTPGTRECSGAGAIVSPPARYTVTTGDSLWRISDQHYSAGQKWPLIYRANRDKISDPDVIFPCQRFLVPRK